MAFLGLCVPSCPLDGWGFAGDLVGKVGCGRLAGRLPLASQLTPEDLLA